MILSQIKRGALRAAALIDSRRYTYQKKLSLSRVFRTTRSVALSLLAVRIVVLPIPIAAPATDPVAAASFDDADPLPYTRQQINPVVLSSLTFNEQSETLLSVASLSLTVPEAGKSLAVSKEEAEQERLRILEAQRRLEAQKKQEEAARREQELRRQEAARILAAQRAAAPVPAGSVQEIIKNAAAKYGVSSTLMLNIAYCESRYNPSAKNRYSSASGLFQFMPTTFATTPQGKSGQSIFNAQASAEAAAWKISQGGLRAWNASKGCWSRR